MVAATLTGEGAVVASQPAVGWATLLFVDLLRLLLPMPRTDHVGVDEMQQKAFLEPVLALEEAPTENWIAASRCLSFRCGLCSCLWFVEEEEVLYHPVPARDDCVLLSFMLTEFFQGLIEEVSVSINTRFSSSRSCISA